MDEMKSDYYQIPGFDFIYLEDSYVLGILEESSVIRFKMLFVLTDKHPLYSPPEKNEMYCYRCGEILFNGVVSCLWNERNISPYIDADGEIDYGNIDEFKFDGEGFFLCGDWGRVFIRSKTPRLIFE